MRRNAHLKLELQQLVAKIGQGRFLCWAEEREALVRDGLLEVQTENFERQDFRHGFISRIILAGIPRYTLAGGHTNDEWKRYLHVTPDQLPYLLKSQEGQNA